MAGTARHRTAMRRAELSRPLRLALQHEVLRPDRSYFDNGCGRGDDLRSLGQLGYSVGGWDPAHRPDAPLTRADVVNLGYVVNVIEDPIERSAAVQGAWALTRSVLVVSARLEDERDDAHVAVARDGWVTRHGTFQKFFTHEELGAWLEAAVGAAPVPAALGVYYLFRDPVERELHLASRFRRPASIDRRRKSDVRFEEHRAALQPMIDFVADHGRLPGEDELGNADELRNTFGSLRKAFQAVLVVTDRAAWDHVRQERAIDLLVHLALARFHGRPRWSELPPLLQGDIRALHTSYRSACQRADSLLFSVGSPEATALVMRASTVGKLTGNALYVHTSAISDLPALLRVYEGCARALLGTAEDADVVKLHRDAAMVTYLTYPGFDTVAHPAVERAVTCDLRQRRVQVTNYDQRANRPILHHKELLVGPTHRKRKTFARLTAREEALGLYEHPERIGTEHGWQAACDERAVTFRGHSITRAAGP